MKWFDKFYRVGRNKADRIFNAPFFDTRFRHIDNRIHPLEESQANYQAELERVEKIGVEQVTQLLSGIAEVANGLAVLGTIQSVRSSTPAEIQSGTVQLFVAEADRAKVPDAASISAVPVGIEGVSMSGYMTFWSADTGEMRVFVTSSQGIGAYSDWIIGLAAPSLAEGGAAASSVTIAEIEDLGEETETVQEALEVAGIELTGVKDRITALESIDGGPDRAALAYAQFVGA